jgi:hypothetical protein
MAMGGNQDLCSTRNWLDMIPKSVIVDTSFCLYCLLRSTLQKEITRLASI